MVDLSHSSADKRLPLGERLVHVVLVIIAFAVGLALNWNWLASLGLAPLLLAILPCAAMCALGLCMRAIGAPYDHQTNPSQKRRLTDA
jgi:uncharacterized membrane protein YadS